MFEELKKYIFKFVSFSDDELEAVISKVKPITLKKNEYFVREGEIAHYIAFTQSGYLRVYYLHDGNEITRDISPLHSFVTALPSFIERKPSFEIIRAITDCDLLVIKKTDLEDLYNK
jgi:CRP-like cAMP-binding protein